MKELARRLGPHRPTRRDLATFAVYVASGCVYVAVGLWTTDFLLSFWVAALYVLVSAWLIPAAVRKLR